MKKKIFMYTSAGILLCLYLIILIMGMDHSRLDDAYYNFYITKDLAYFTRMDEFGTYRDNTLLEYKTSGNYRNQGRGWAPVEDEATWCVGNESDFYLYVDEPGKPHELVIDAAEDLGYKNYLTVNGERVGDIEFGLDKVASVSFSSGLHEGLNRFAICTDDEVADVYGNMGTSGDEGRHNLYVATLMLREVK
ncbi:MAG: hypothetical protein K5857_02780 [Lachnospiraceae bacterium]|nr:hypothetical protein [Lachnospiraceae bacterium]